MGSFPPPYGGVTVKNALLYNELAERVDIDRIDLSAVKKGDAALVAKLIKAIFGRKGTLVIGVSANWRYIITVMMRLFNEKKMSRSLLIFMGGKVPDSRAYMKRLGQYKRIYVETESMKRSFEDSGAKNVSVYPNCRVRPSAPCEVCRMTNRKRGS